MDSVSVSTDGLFGKQWLFVTQEASVILRKYCTRRAEFDD
jgi:hypothetical protein